MSNMSERDRKALSWGGIGVAAIVLFNYVLSPVMQRWNETSDRLESREAFIASFRDRVETRDALRTRRDVLALRMGSLRVLHPKVEEKPKEEPKDGEKKPEKDDGKTPPEGDKKKEEPKADSAKEPSKAGDSPDVKSDGDLKMAENDEKKEGKPEGEKETSEQPPIEPPAEPGKADEMVVAKNSPGDEKASSEEAPTEADDTKEDVKPEDTEQKSGEAKPAEEKAPEGAKDEAASKGDGEAKGDQGADAKPNEPSKEGAPDEKKAKKPEKPAQVAVPTIEASSLSTYVEKTAKTANVKIKRITPKKNISGKKRTKYFEPVTIQVSFECQATNLVQLFHELEKGELFVRIDKVEITRNIEQGDKLTASLDLSSYEPKKEVS